MTSRPEPAGAGAPAIPLLPGMAAVAGAYDGFIVDLWGTVHDGVRPLPGATDCLGRLRAAGKRVLILSNAPRRVDAVVARMTAIGITADLYDAALSSGEATWRALKERADPWHRALGRACYMMGAVHDDSTIAGLGLERAGDVARADFIACLGLKAGETLADYEDLLRAAAARRLPMVCANPDLEVIRGGVRELCAGALAARYEALGGEVRYHGKPHAPIYGLSVDLLGIGDLARILAVGDSLRTDVAGAAGAGLDALFIAGGIHAAELQTAPGEAPDPARLAALCAAAGQTPVAALAAFRW